MKWTGGPVVAHAEVSRVVEIPECSPDQLRESVQGFGLYDLTEYWESLPDHFYALTILLSNEQWLETPRFPPRLSYAASWVVLDSAEAGKWPAEPSDLPPRIGTLPQRAPNPALRFQVLRRDGFTCTYCGRRPPDVELHVDHEIPYSGGGLTVLENLRTACRDCNLGKGKTRL
jgi:hypothetical protein